MMPNNGEFAIREPDADEKTGIFPSVVDFTVPVIDNFGDLGFALSLGISLLDRNPGLRIRFFSENRELFGNMLGGKIPERLSYFPLETWAKSERSPVRFNFFGYGIREGELAGRENPKKILNFDYLQFHRGTGPADPGIASLHGTEYEIGGKKIVHVVPSPLSEGGGVVVPRNSTRLTRMEFLENLGLPKAFADRKWCGVFAYPKTMGRILECAKKRPEWGFFVCGSRGTDSENVAYLPFLPLRAYDGFVRLCDTNVVRGENSLVSAILAGKPFLWDIYREKNGAHLEKMADFREFVNGYADWGVVLEDFMNEPNPETSLAKLLDGKPDGFAKMAEAVGRRDLARSVEAFVAVGDS